MPVSHAKFIHLIKGYKHFTIATSHSIKNKKFASSLMRSEIRVQALCFVTERRSVDQR